MSTQEPISARSIAIKVLNRFDPQKDFAAQILDKLLAQTEQRQRATDIVYGLIRNLSAIDMVITKLAGCPISRIPKKICNITRLGAYELIYSPQTPEYAIINEAVENAKAIAAKKQAGFVNAVLRQITRNIKNRQVKLSDADAQKTLPQNLSTGCEFDQAILSDPETKPAYYLSETFSLPEWLVKNWLEEFGYKKARQICFASNRKPTIYLRPNPLKTTVQELTQKFSNNDIDFEICQGAVIKLIKPGTVSKLPGFAEGLFTIQDLTAGKVVEQLQPKQDWLILDLCAAPGTKTTHLAEFTADKSRIFATDIDSQRLKKVKENVERLALKSVHIIPYDKLQQTAAELDGFDCILIDVPCSNAGVLAKRPEVRFRIKPASVKKLAKIQLQILQTANQLLKPTGTICYSTCSIQQQENSKLIAKFLSTNPNYKFKTQQLTLPIADNLTHDGGYFAILRKCAD